MSGPTLHELTTPALILDRARLEANAAAMTARAARLGPRLRPHLKTGKSLDVAQLALRGNFGGLTVSTLREAEAFADGGLTDIRYAVCISPDKFGRAARLAEGGVRLSLITDDASVAGALGAFAERRGVRFDVLVELDVGEHRTGVDPASEELLTVARAVHEAPTLSLAGVLAHGGHSYGCRDPHAVAEVAEQERSLSVSAAERLRAAGLPCREVSIGSTPTVMQARSAEGVTELRPGVYVFFDLFQAAIGSCRLRDIALSVLATVISHRPREGRLVLDAGALALSKDRSTAATAHDRGYGLLTDLSGAPLDDLIVTEVHQEHGEVAGARPIDLPVGSRVRVLPNHACMTAAMYERYHVVEGSDPRVVARWERVNGWEGA
jgi:D-serine deaminase-like pyridoxal phosphate-dependent protein